MCHSFKTLMCDMTKVGSHSKHCSIHRSSSKSFIWKTFLLWFIVMKTRDKNMLTMVLTAKTLINIYHNMLGGNRMITKFVWVWMQTTAVEAVLTETDMQNVHAGNRHCDVGGRQCFRVRMTARAARTLSQDSISVPTLLRCSPTDGLR